MDFDTFRPILSGLVGGFVVYLLPYSGRKPAATEGGRRLLIYGLGIRIFTAILIPSSLFIAYAAAHAHPDQAILAVCIAAAFFSYQVFFVSLAYDNDNIYYRSPIGGNHVIPWPDVVEVGYSWLMQSYYLRTKQVRRIWCSNMLRGYNELEEFIPKKADKLFHPELKSYSEAHIN